MLDIAAAVGLVLVAAVAVLLIYAATRPDHFRIVRSTAIAAPPEKIYALINDLRQFNQWNPFAKGDPSLKIAYGASSTGLGASYDWEGSGRTGKGRMKITEVMQPSSVTMSLHFDRPMKAHNTVVFRLQSNSNATDVSWEMTGASPFISKVMAVCFNMDKMVGGEFTKGLATLKALAEQ